MIQLSELKQMDKESTIKDELILEKSSKLQNAMRNILSKYDLAIIYRDQGYATSRLLFHETLIKVNELVNIFLDELDLDKLIYDISKTDLFKDYLVSKSIHLNSREIQYLEAIKFQMIKIILQTYNLLINNYIELSDSVHLFNSIKTDSNLNQVIKRIKEFDKIIKSNLSFVSKITTYEIDRFSDKYVIAKCNARNKVYKQPKPMNMVELNLKYKRFLENIPYCR